PNSHTASPRRHKSESLPSLPAASRDSSPRPTAGPQSPLARFVAGSQADRDFSRSESDKRAGDCRSDDRVPEHSTAAEKQSHRTLESPALPATVTVEAIGTFQALEDGTHLPSSEHRCVQSQASVCQAKALRSR